MEIKKATSQDLDSMDRFYRDVHQGIVSTKSPSTWLAGVYPVRKTAELAIESGSLFLLWDNGTIAASVNLDNHQDSAYQHVPWRYAATEEELLVVHTLAVHPSYYRKGCAKQLLDFAKAYGRENSVKTLRLDVLVENTKAQDLYQQQGFVYLETIQLNEKRLQEHRYKTYDFII